MQLLGEDSEPDQAWNPQARLASCPKTRFLPVKEKRRITEVDFEGL